MQIPSLQEYLLVAQEEPRIEVFRRPDRGHWLRDEARAGQTITIGGRAIPVDDVYRRAAG